MASSLDLSTFSKDLESLFAQYPVGDYCDRCANNLSEVLRRRSDYAVAILTIQNETVPGLPDIRPAYIGARLPDGSGLLLAQTGFHQVCRIGLDGDFYFLDALVYLHYGSTAVDRDSYFGLFEYPDGIEITSVRVLK
jgi:hypothetical protein